MEGRGKMHGECKRFAEPGCEWRRDRGRTPHTRGNKGVKARAESMPGQEERKKERGKERERERAVICHGKRPFSQYYFPQSVINCAHISPFSTASLLLLSPFSFCRCPFFVFNR